MEEPYKLTTAERAIMECLWSSMDGMTFKDLTDRVGEQYGKLWKKQTLSTYLGRLQMMGLVKSSATCRPHIYTALCTKAEFMRGKIRALVRDEYDGSLGNFIASFVGEEKLSPEEAQELRDLLDRLCSDKK